MKKLKSIITAVLITLSFIMVIGVITSAAMMMIENAEDHISLISGGAQLIYLIGAVLILRIRKVNLAGRCGIAPAQLKAFLLPCAAAFCFSVFSNVLQEALPIPKFLTGETNDMVGKSVIAFIAAIFIIAPITEEFVFRGLIMTTLRGAMGALPAVLVSALLFGMIHLMTGSVITCVHALLGGFIFGLAYEKSGSLFAAVAAHICGNLGGMVPDLLHGLENTVQLIISAAAAIASIALCTILIRKAPEQKRNM